MTIATALSLDTTIAIPTSNGITNEHDGMRPKKPCELLGFAAIAHRHNLVELVMSRHQITSIWDYSLETRHWRVLCEILHHHEPGLSTTQVLNQTSVRQTVTSYLLSHCDEFLAEPFTIEDHTHNRRIINTCTGKMLEQVDQLISDNLDWLESHGHRAQSAVTTELLAALNAVNLPEDFPMPRLVDELW